jgi:hypothetical protein
LVILLSGIRFLGNLRGIKSVESHIHAANESYAAVTCKITFIPSFETNNQEFVYTDSASAHFGNCNGFGKAYLVEMATNRAFARCIRSSLRVGIVSKEELSAIQSEEQPEQQSEQITKNITVKLENLMKEKGIDFETIKQRLIKTKVPNAESFNSIQDFSPPLVFKMIEKLQNVKS